jgi:hypothetical protein
MHKQKADFLSSQLFHSILANPDFLSVLTDLKSTDKLIIGSNCHIIFCPEPANIKFLFCNVGVDTAAPLNYATHLDNNCLWSRTNDIVYQLEQIKYLKNRQEEKEQKINKIQKKLIQQELSKNILETTIREKLNTLKFIKPLLTVRHFATYKQELLDLNKELQKKTILMKKIRKLLEHEEKKRKQIEICIMQKNRIIWECLLDFNEHG